VNAALIFANGDVNDGVMVRRALAQFPDALVIAADGGARVALAYELYPQVVIGDMDSIAPEMLAVLEVHGAEIHGYRREKDETDLELALRFAAEQGAQAIRVIGAVGDRLDHTLSNIALLALPALAGLDVRLVARGQMAWLAAPGECVLEGAPGDTVSLLPMDGAVEGLETDGLYYPLRQERLTFGPARGMSNVMTGAQARVRSASGLLLIIHTAGEG
jgi:thiamine pyrophosphokinase